jgi:hypothetical protein
LKEELIAYDDKVFKASQEMFRGMSFEMKALGVPFFGVSEDLISLDGPKPGITIDRAGLKLEDNTYPKVTQEELTALQRKMIQYLEDMYRIE